MTGQKRGIYVTYSYSKIQTAKLTNGLFEINHLEMSSLNL